VTDTLDAQCDRCDRTIWSHVISGKRVFCDEGRSIRARSFKIGHIVLVRQALGKSVGLTMRAAALREGWTGQPL
jgi:hypothetical protein